MLISLLNWIYIFATTFVIGFFLIPRMAKLIGAGDVRPNWCDSVVAGLVTATVYAEIFSLFYKVGLVANLIMIICCVLFIYLDRARIKEMAGKRLHLPDNMLAKTCIIALAFGAAVIFALSLMFTAESSFHYDTGLYHAQAIHWLEDYGVIKGLGLIHVRFAYNSAYFPLCALYSMRDVTGGQSLHSMSGFLFALMCIYSVYGLQRAIIRKHPDSGRTFAVSTCVRLAPFLYFLVCILEITSPESDYVTGNLIIWVFLRLAEIYEEEVDGDKLAGYCLVSICSFALIGFKLSAAVIPLITLWPLVILIRKKQWKSIGICAILCALMVLPYVARNVMICGWPVYPFAHFDMFNVPWKFEKSMLEGDAAEIGKWAKGLHVEGAQNSSYVEWLRYWWNEQYYASKMFISSLIMSVVLFLFTFLDRKRWFIKYLVFVMAATLAFYMVSAPLIRYCYGPVLVMPLMIVGYILDLSSKKSSTLIAFSIVAVCIVLYPTYRSVKALVKYDYEEASGRFSPHDYLIKQVDYPMADVREVEWFGYKVYLPNEGDQCWYYAFPSSPYHEGFDLTEPISGDLGKGVVRRN